MMNSKLWGIFVGSSLLIGIALASGPIAFAQFKSSSIVEDETHTSNRESDDVPEFQVRESIHLGFGGIERITSFGMIDEYGAQYDTMTLFLRSQQARDDIELSEEQYKEMWAISEERSKKLKPMLASIVTGTLNKSDVEAEFHAFEDQINGVLAPEQLEQLERVKAQAQVREHGLAKYLGMKKVREKFGVSSEDISRLKELIAASEKEAREKKKSWLREANEELLSRLSASQRERLNAGLGEKGIESFLDSNMFSEVQKGKKKPNRKYSDPLRTLKLKSLSTKLKVSKTQREEIKSLGEGLPSAAKRDREKVQEELAEILSPEQMMGVNRAIVDRQLARMGTVFALTCGHLPDVVGLKQEQADELFDEGVEISSELQAKLNGERLKVAQAALERISLQSRGELDQILSGSLYR